MIEIQSKVVYRSSKRGKTYLTLQAAAKAEARRTIEEKYPTEKSSGTGYERDPGWHWTSMPRSQVMYRRLTRLILRKFREKQS